MNGAIKETAAPATNLLCPRQVENAEILFSQCRNVSDSITAHSGTLDKVFLPLLFPLFVYLRLLKHGARASPLPPFSIVIGVAFLSSLSYNSTWLLLSLLSLAAPHCLFSFACLESTKQRQKRSSEEVGGKKSIHPCWHEKSDIFVCSEPTEGYPSTFSQVLIGR